MVEQSILEFFARWIESQCGITYSEQSYYQLSDRLEAFTKSQNLESVSVLMNEIKTRPSSELRQKLIDVATNNETSFFRDEKFFRYLETSLLPELARARGGLSAVRIWSVASSTGQEPYSVAILISELGQRLGQKPPQLLATDISDRALGIAKKGQYSDFELGRGMSAGRRARYFKAIDKSVSSIQPHLREIVEFRKINLVEHFNLKQKFDLILCRNVLIYQKADSKTVILDRLGQHLDVDGRLALGAGESIIGLSPQLEPVLDNGVYLYRLRQVKKNVA